MILNDMLKQDNTKKVVENPGFIEVSKRTVRFGDSIYQLRNITGFEIGEIPKQELNVVLLIILIIGGILLISVVIGIVLLGIAVWMLVAHFGQTQKYGLILELNSGKTTSFVSSDKVFLREFVSALYQLMEGDLDGLVVNWNDRSVKVYGQVKGAISTGEHSNIQYDS